MTRTYTAFAERGAKPFLEVLAEKKSDPLAYQSAMEALGKIIGDILVEKKTCQEAELFIICTAEDADYLAKGIIEITENSTAFENVKLACFWNNRIQELGVSAAPILRRYREPFDKNSRLIFVVVKSIISSGCVVKTNLTNLIKEADPESIIIAAPVMLKDADEGLKAEFDCEISKRFEFITFAYDDERTEEGEVVPGVGGNVYIRLGFSSQEDKNSITPMIVKERRLQRKMSLHP